MAVDEIKVRGHIGRALAAQVAEPHVLRQFTRAFRLLQAERREAAAALDEDLAAAEHYLFARQAVASNAVSLTQMLLIVVGCDTTRHAVQRMGAGATGPASQDSIGWGVAGAMVGEADREKFLPGSVPPPFRPAFMKASVPATAAGI
jgi:hypothetical protein